MGFFNHKSQQNFPFSYERVFQGLVFILEPAGFNVLISDMLIGRITANTLGSAFSWGENIVIIVEKIDGANTLITIESSLKLGMAGAHRHWQNIERIIGALSYYLQNGDLWPEAKSSSSSTSKKPGIVVGIILASILLIIILFSVAADIE